MVSSSHSSTLDKVFVNDHLVLLKVAQLAERVLAELAHVGSQSSVAFEVVFDVTRLGKHLAAPLDIALVVQVGLACLRIHLVEGLIPVAWKPFETFFGGL